MVSQLEGTDEVVYYNDCFYICKDRKKLREKSHEIKNGWIEQLEAQLEMAKDIKLINKY